MLPLLDLDPLDRDIVRQLQEDGRRSFREIGRTLDVAEATVRTRIKRMQDSGILRILAFADPSKMGAAKLALIFVEVAAESHERLIDTLGRWNEVCYLSTTLGSADVCMQVMVTDDEQLWAVRQRVRGLPGVGEVRILPEVEVHKMRFSIPAED